MDITELFEEVDQALAGYINIPGLAQMLPDVNNAEMFDDAMDKIRLGQGSYLTVPEKMQLALAWISLVGLNATQKSQIFRLLSASRAVPKQAQPQTAAQVQPGQTAPTGSVR